MRPVTITVSGPLFDRPSERLTAATRDVVLRLGAYGADVMRYAMLNQRVYRSGRAASSVRAVHVARSARAVGYVKIMPTDVWSGELRIRQTGTTIGKRGRRIRTWSVSVVRSEGSRPPRTWLAYGIRGGRKLGRTRNFFGTTRRDLARRVNEPYWAALIAGALQ